MSNRGNPITPQSAVVINGYYDRHFTVWRQRNASNRVCSVDDASLAQLQDVSIENFSVLPRELAFKLLPEYDQYIQRPSTTASQEGGPRVFTSANGFPFFENPDDKKTKDLRDHVVFVGLPLIPIDAANANQKDSISIMVAGSTTITNTGPYRITAGDLVMWDLPATLAGARGKAPGASGVPRNKALFVTLPVNARGDGGDNSVLSTTIKEVIASVRAAAKPARAAAGRKRARVTDEAVAHSFFNACLEGGGNTAQNIEKLVECVMVLVAKQHRRIIGVALSNADAGENFDILLRGGGAF